MRSSRSSISRPDSIALGAITLAGRPADERHAYGHDKAEYFSSGVEGALILVAAVAIIVSAIRRLVDPQPIDNLGPGLVIAFIAGAANFAAARVMLKAARAHDSITIEADAKHLLTDVWTSAGILAGLLIVMAMPQWAILDPLMAIAVGIHIIKTGFDLVRRSADGLMDAALPPDEVERAETLIRDELCRRSASFTRCARARRARGAFSSCIWSFPAAMSVADSHALCDRIEASLAAHLARAHVTIHVEPRGDAGAARIARGVSARFRTPRPRAPTGGSRR